MAVGCRLRYTMQQATQFVSQIEAANGDDQVAETLRLPRSDQGSGDPVNVTIGN